MNPNNFTVTFLVNESVEHVYKAINNVRGWWQGTIVGKTDELNEEFIYNFGETHISTQKIVELIPNKKVVWLVSKSKLNFIKDMHEWDGTKIIFEISPMGNQTQIKFTHEGLVPEIECYGACSNAWTQLVQQSLRSLIETGKGKKIF